jgi:hypothetical protein
MIDSSDLSGIRALAPQTVLPARLSAVNPAGLSGGSPWSLAAMVGAHRYACVLHFVGRHSGVR